MPGIRQVFLNKSHDKYILTYPVNLPERNVVLNDPNQSGL